MTAQRIVAILLGLLYAAAASVQFDDPDTGPWFAMYGTAALCSLVFALPARRAPSIPARRGAACAIAIAALAWAGTIAKPAIDAGISIDSELTRELGGLAIVAAGLLALAATARPR